MSDVIRLLPDSVANQIAAGEVIQRPASVIKELVENSVDAGAKSIKIILRDGGKNLIQVIDDGCGMSDTDARLAFERHATSKITQAADLFDLHTMGFRGEALPSIAAVAQIDLRTMKRGETIGTHLNIAASKFESQVPEACPPGSNLSVKNLFFNFPARRKFLKKDSVELTHIVHEFERLALVNPDKEFLLMHNDVTLHQLLPGSMKQRVVDLFGKSLAKQLIPVTTETSLVKINGLVSLPANTRKRNALQYFFVNGRNMRHPYFQKAVLHCYEELIPSDHQPNFFLNFEVDPSTIDVNIHPTKSEIKFENEAPIWQILVAAIKEALGKFNAVPSIDFDSTDTIDIPVFDPSTVPSFTDVPSANYNPFAPAANRSDNAPSELDEFPASPTSHMSGSALNSLPPDLSTDFPGATFAPSAGFGRAGGGSVTSPSRLGAPRSAADDWDRLYREFQSATTTERMPDISDFTSPAPSSPFGGTPSHPLVSSPSALGSMELPDMGTREVTGVLQLKNRYLIAPSAKGLMVIDRHRAHLKVLYERYLRFTEQNSGEMQQVLFPETITLSPSQNVVLESMSADVRTLGFDLSYLGDNVWAINGIPASIAKLNPKDTLLKMIESVEDDTLLPGADLHHRTALSMARAAAVQHTQSLTEAETDTLLSQFFSLSDPAYTPDGNPTYFILDLAEISNRLS